MRWPMPSTEEVARSTRQATFACLSIILVLTLLPTIAFASPPDASWIAGIYDDADGDDVVALVYETAAAIATMLGDAPSLSRLPEKSIESRAGIFSRGSLTRSTRAPPEQSSESSGFLTTAFLPASPRNMPHVNDPVVTEFILRQLWIQDPAKRREVIHATQRYLSKQVYGVDVVSAVVIGIWDQALKNYGPNFGFDYGGRLMAAWLDR